MKTFYDYILYKFYCYMLRYSSKYDPEEGVVVGFSLVILLYLFGFLIYLGLWLKTIIPNYKIILIIYGMLIALCYMFNLFYFKKNKRYLAIKEKFEKESKRQQILGNIFVILFCLGSIIWCFLSFFIEKP